MTKKAFTLAETLITMAVIGVIAVLTLPTLMNNYMRKVCATQLRKVASQITTATKTIIADEKADELNDVHNVDIIDEDVNGAGFYMTTAVVADGNNASLHGFLRDYFISKTNGDQCGSDCIADSYRDSAGNQIIGTSQGIDKIYDSYDCIQTPENATICMHRDPADGRVKVFIDVNGKQTPNIAGVDLYFVQITDSGSLEDVNSEHIGNCGTGGDLATAASGCYAKVIRNGWKIVD